MRLQESLHFIATELHKGSAPLYAPTANDEYKAAVKERLTGRFGMLAAMLGDKPWLFGDFTVADGYAFYVLRAPGSASPRRSSPSPLAATSQRLASPPFGAEGLEAEAVPAPDVSRGRAGEEGRAGPRVGVVS